MASYTITLTGNTNELSANIFPEITLDDRYNYSCGLLDFTTYQSIPNIIPPYNTLIFGKLGEKNSFHPEETFELAEGCYEADDVLHFIKLHLESKGYTFEYEINKHTLKTTIESNAIFAFSDGCLLELLGFDGKKFVNLAKNEADSLVKVSRVNAIRIECNIVTGAYVNGNLCHTIYEFANNTVDNGYKIIEQPRNVVYLPIASRRISNVHIYMVDQDGNPIDFRGETITCRIHIKRDKKE